MHGARNAASSGLHSSPGASGEAAAEPIRWLGAGDASPAVSTPHRHHCSLCGGGYQCDGPDPAGVCAQICPPCYWAVLGAQLESYQEIVGELRRKREKIARRVGIEACRRAEARRRRRASSDASFVVAMDAERALR